MNAPNLRNNFLSGSRLHRFETLQHCLVPRSKIFSPEEAQRSRTTINLLLSQQSPSAQRKLTIFLSLFDLIACLRYARTFKQLSAQQQTRVLNFFFNSPIGLLRKGFWGLNTLARLGVYSQTELHQELGYKLKPEPNKEPA